MLLPLTANWYIILTGKILIEKYPHLRVIAITSHEESWFLKNMMKAGAKGFLLKSAPPDHIIEAITAVCRGKECIQPEMKDLLLNLALRTPWAGANGRGDGVVVI